MLSSPDPPSRSTLRTLQHLTLGVPPSVKDVCSVLKGIIRGCRGSVRVILGSYRAYIGLYLG